MQQVIQLVLIVNHDYFSNLQRITQHMNPAGEQQSNATFSANSVEPSASVPIELAPSVPIAGQPAAAINDIAIDPIETNTATIKKCLSLKLPFLSSTVTATNPRIDGYFRTFRIELFPDLRLVSFTTLICLILLCVFIAEGVVGYDKHERYFLGISEDGLWQMQANYPYEVYFGEFQRTIVSLFLSQSLIHLIFSLIGTAAIVSRLEHSFGFIRTLFVFFMSGIMGNMFFNVISSDPENHFTAGVYTSLFGCCGALYGYFIINMKGIQFLPHVIRASLINYLIIILIFAVLSMLGMREDNYGMLGSLLGGVFLSAIFPGIEKDVRQKVWRVVFGLLALTQLITTICIFFISNPILAPQTQT